MAQPNWSKGVGPIPPRPANCLVWIAEYQLCKGSGCHSVSTERGSRKARKVEIVAKLLNRAIEELGRLLNAKDALGDPIEREIQRSSALSDLVPVVAKA